jgi:hypothetical protein
MKCLIASVLEMLSHIAAPCIMAFREGSEKMRALRSRAETAEKECLDWKEKYHAAEFRIQKLGEKLATAYAAIGILVIIVILCMIFPQTRVPIGLVGLSIVFGSQLLPMANKLGPYATNFFQHASRVSEYANDNIRQILPALDRLIKQSRNRMREWRWRSVPISRSFGTSH